MLEERYQNEDYRWSQLFTENVQNYTNIIQFEEIGYPRVDILKQELDAYRLFQFSKVVVNNNIEVSFKLRMNDLYSDEESIFFQWVKLYRELKGQKQKKITKEIMNHLLTWSTNAELNLIPSKKIILDLKQVLFKLFLKVKRVSLSK